MIEGTLIAMVTIPIEQAGTGLWGLVSPRRMAAELRSSGFEGRINQ